MYKDVREQLNLTLEQMADQIGVDVKTIQTWEKGEEKPSRNIQSVFFKLKNKLVVLERIKKAAGELDLQNDFSEFISELKNEITKEQTVNTPSPHDEVLIDHLEFSIDEYIRKHGFETLNINKHDLALHIYRNIKFLF